MRSTPIESRDEKEQIKELFDILLKLSEEKKQESSRDLDSKAFILYQQLVSKTKDRKKSDAILGVDDITKELHTLILQEIKQRNLTEEEMISIYRLSSRIPSHQTTIEKENAGRAAFLDALQFQLKENCKKLADEAKEIASLGREIAKKIRVLSINKGKIDPWLEAFDQYNRQLNESQNLNGLQKFNRILNTIELLLKADKNSKEAVDLAKEVQSEIRKLPVNFNDGMLRGIYTKMGIESPNEFLEKLDQYNSRSRFNPRKHQALRKEIFSYFTKIESLTPVQIILFEEALSKINMENPLLFNDLLSILQESPEPLPQTINLFDKISPLIISISTISSDPKYCKVLEAGKQTAIGFINDEQKRDRVFNNYKVSLVDSKTFSSLMQTARLLDNIMIK